MQTGVIFSAVEMETLLADHAEFQPSLIILDWDWFKGPSCCFALCKLSDWRLPSHRMNLASLLVIKGSPNRIMKAQAPEKLV